MQYLQDAGMKGVKYNLWIAGHMPPDQAAQVQRPLRLIFVKETSYLFRSNYHVLLYAALASCMLRKE